MANYNTILKSIKDSELELAQYRELRDIINDKIRPLASEANKAKREERKEEWVKSLKPHYKTSEDGKKILVYEAYSIKNALKELGGKYNGKEKAWEFPNNKFFSDEIKKLIK